MSVIDRIAELARDGAARLRPGRDRTLPLAVRLALGGVALAAGGLGAYMLREKLANDEPEFTLMEREGAFSLRRYDPLVIASTHAEGVMTDALNGGFERLLAYIAAKHGGRAAGADHARIAMTVPVLARSPQGSVGWDVRFIMPRERTIASLPAPARGIELSDVPGRLVAAVRFGGRWGDRARLAERRAALLAWVSRRGLRLIGDPEFAAYNAPIVPPPLRRNEWLVAVARGERDAA